MMVDIYFGFYIRGQCEKHTFLSINGTRSAICVCQIVYDEEGVDHVVDILKYIAMDVNILCY